MKSTTFNIENHTITYHVTWLGMESVSVDGNVVSKKLSLGKRVHSFDLLINDETQTFRVESKLSFTQSNVTVNLFQNNILLEATVLELYAEITGSKTDANGSNNSDSTFVIGMVFIILSLCFDWSKFFLFIGLIFMFNAISTKDKQSKTSENNTDLEIKD